MSHPGADLIEIQGRPNHLLRERLHQWLIFRDATALSSRWNLAFERIEPRRSYDLMIVHVPLIQDLVQLSAVRDCMDSFRTTVCWVDEIWTSEIPLLKRWFPLLERFDYLFTSLQGSVKTLCEVTSRRWGWLPLAVDTLRFCPHPAKPQRVIDIFSMGRRSQSLHDELVRHAARKRAFFLYDTVDSMSMATVSSHVQHRDMLAGLVQRSSAFVIAPAKTGDVEQGEQIEVGLRFFEGASGGCVLVGEAPDSESFEVLFPWQDAVVPILDQGTNAAELLLRVSEDEQWVESIRRRNVVESLRRHDWVYRWRTLFEACGFEASRSMLDREDRLQRLADSLGRTT